MDAYTQHHIMYLKPRGLDENAMYETELEDGKVIKMSGKTLMKVGLPFDLFVSQYESRQFYIKKV